MGFTPLKGRRYDMPAMFGPSPVPDRTVIEDAHAIVLSFPTSRDAAEMLLPNHFRLPDAVTASISYVSYQDVDYLGGQGYNEIVVTLSALHGEVDDTIAAGFAPILWVNKVGALIAGREYMGLPKLFGTIPDAVISDSDAHFSCYEDHTLLLKGDASALRQLAPEVLDRVNEKAREVGTFGWKYIAAADGGSDLDYPLINVMRWHYNEAWSGNGSIEILTPDRAAAPFSAAALSVLTKLPLEGPVRAFRGKGRATIDRRATRKLAAANHR